VVQFSVLQNPLHNFNTGNFSIVLNATNMYGSNLSTQTSWINITPVPTFPPIAAFHANVTTICMSDYIQFTDDSVNATTWFWLFGSGGVDSHLQHPVTNTFDTAGLWDVRLQATNADGSDWENKTGYITVNNCTPPPTPTGISALCQGSFIAVNGTVPADSFDWDFGDGGTASGLNVTHTFEWGRGYRITLSTLTAGVMENRTKYYDGCENQQSTQQMIPI
jgi:PKD repeat protein